jgi:DNA polymerase-3 subunit alpha
VVATHPIQYAKPDDYEAHEARVCIAEGEILGNAKRVRKFTRDQYFKTAAEMERCLPTFRARSRTRWKLPAAAA